MKTLILAALPFLLITPSCASKESDKSAKKEGSSSASPVGACDHRPSDHYCNEYFGRATKKWIGEQCVGDNTLGETCTKEKAVGRCISMKGKPSEVHVVYYEPMTKEGAQAMCKGADMELAQP